MGAPALDRCPHDDCGAPLAGALNFCWSCHRYTTSPEPEPDLGHAAGLVHLSGTTDHSSSPPDDNRLEDEIEHAIDETMQALGYRAVRFSQPRASKQTPGIPDRLYVHETRERWTFAEIKRRIGRLSEAQQELHAVFLAAGIPVVVWRHENDAIRWHEEVS